jgi:beta-phosphoglucomutase-like phosphatase (HAD superfamily)
MLWQWANNRVTVFILDLDGTLIPSAKIDNQCFWQAVFECFDRRGTLPDLHGFKHVTDTGILYEWCIRALGRVASHAETRQIRDRFLQLFEQAARLKQAGASLVYKDFVNV